jgi:hypothetical protein
MLFSYAGSRVIVMNEPGKLYQLLPADEVKTVTDLTISGPIDARDVFYLRDSSQVLARINLKDAEIKECRGKFKPFNDTLTFVANELPAAAFTNYVYQRFDSTLTEVVLPESLTSIGQSAFLYCDQLSKVNIPEGVTTIGEMAFSGTRATLGIDPLNNHFSIVDGMLMNKSHTSLLFCPVNRIGGVLVPEGINEIKPGAFSYCDSIEALILPSTLSSVGIMAFEKCTGMLVLELNTPPDVFGNYPNQFGGISVNQVHLTVPYGMRTLYNSLFFWKGFSTITEKTEGIYVQPASLQFPYDTSKKLVVVNATAPWTAMAGQPWLKLSKTSGMGGKDTVWVEVEQNTGSSIRLETVFFSIEGVVPQRVVISQMAAPLELEVSAGKLWQQLPDSLRKANNALIFSGTMDASDFKVLRDSMPTLQLLDLSRVQLMAYSGPNGTRDNVTDYPADELPSYGLFRGYKNVDHSLSRVILPRTTKSIGDAAFVYCYQLDSVHFGDSLKVIGLAAFQGCNSLRHLNFPATVTQLKSYGFMSCYGVQSVTVNNPVPFSLAADFSALSDIDRYKCILRVPFGSAATYAKTAYWKEFRKIQEFGTGVGLSVASVKLPSTGSRYAAVKVNASGPWIATANQPWVKLTSSQGVPGDSLRLTVEAEYNYLQRTAQVLVMLQDSSKMVTLNIVQGELPKTITATPGNLYNLLSATERSSLTNLRVNGSIDSRDFVTLRDQLPKLAILKLDSAKIVAYSGSKADEIPANAFYSTTTSTGKTSLYKISLPATIKAIGTMAFRECTHLSAIALSDSVHAIRNQAFTNCASLDTFNFSVRTDTIGNQAFSGCVNLTATLLPPAIRFIGNEAFARCGLLTELRFPISLNYLGAGAFQACSALQKVTAFSPVPLELSKSPGVFADVDLSKATLMVPFFSRNAYLEANQWKDFGTIGELPGGLVAGNDTILLLKGKTTDTFQLYSNDSWVISSSESWLTLPVDSGSGPVLLQLTASVNDTPELRKAMITATIPGVKSVEILVVQEGTVLTLQAEAGKLNEQLTADDLRFRSGLVLTGILDARDFKLIRDRMPLLESLDVAKVNIADYTGTAGSGGSNSIVYAANTLPAKALIGKSGIIHLELPGSLTAFGDESLKGCTGLKEINFSTSITSIGKSAFENCTGLTQLWLPETLTSAGDNAFNACDSVQWLLIPRSVTSIGGNAFSIKNLKTIIAVSETPVALFTAGVFSAVDKANCKLYVPKGAKSNYLNYMQWKDFANILEDFLKFGGGDTLRVVSGQELDLQLLTDQQWHLQADNGWLTVSDSTGSGQSGFRLFTAENPGFESRTGSVTATIFKSMKFKLVVIQSGKPVTVNIQSGGLNAAVNQEDKNRITHLIVKGTMDQRDFTVLRDQFPLLATLDLSGVSITQYAENPGLVHKANEIPANAFYVAWSGQGKKHLATVIFPEALTGIGKSAFGYTPQLQRIVMPDAVTSLGEYAFMYCRALKEVHLSKQLTVIPDYAFYICDQLDTINIPEGIQSVGYQSFFCCYALKHLTLPSTISILKKDAFAACRALESINLPEGITTIEEDLFYFCGALTRVNIPSSVTKIGSGAFYTVPAKNLVLPPNLTEVGARAFGKCSGLTSISLPRTLTKIGYGAFEFCYGLREIYAYNPTPVDLSAHYYALVFNSVPDALCTLYVPAGSRSAYRSAVEWGRFQKIIEMTTATHEVPAGALVLAPNPVTDYLHLEGLTAGADVRIFDLKGREWLKANLQPGELLDVRSLPQGTYLLMTEGQALKMIKK